MWRGEDAPSLPKVPESPSKPSSEFKPASMNNELEQLRQRGLAKKLSSYFTKEVDRLKAQKEAAEAAIRDLEARKAATREFEPNSQEISQLDAIYMKLNAWKKECAKKERETILLYQRSLEKYGNSVKVLSPEELMTPAKVMPANYPQKTSPIATAAVGELAEAFETAANEYGVPEFLCPKDSPAASSFDKDELEEILEDSCLPDPEGTVVRCESPQQTAGASGDFDDDDLSVLSGLTTLNSAKTREVLHDVGNQVIDFIKNETEQIKKLMEDEDASIGARSISVTSRSRSQVDSIADDSAKATEAEDMVQRMQQILEEFKNQEAETSKELQKNVAPRRIATGNDNEVWYEHFDETYQRHFYVEANTKKTQWHAPPSVTELSEDSASSVCESATVVSAASTTLAPLAPSHEDFRPEPRSMRRSTRISQYRAKRRRQRNRRIIAFSVVAASLGCAATYYKQLYPDEKLWKLVPEGTEQQFEQLMNWANNVQAFIEFPRGELGKTQKPSEKTKPTKSVSASTKKDTVLPPSATVDFLDPLSAGKNIFEETIFSENEVAAKEAVVINAETLEEPENVDEPKVPANQIEAKPQKTLINHLVQALAGPLYYTTVYVESRRHHAY